MYIVFYSTTLWNILFSSSSQIFVFFTLRLWILVIKLFNQSLFSNIYSQFINLITYSFLFVDRSYLCQKWIKYTAWKVSKYGVFSGPYFPVFGLNTDFYYSGQNKTQYLVTFHAVIAIHIYKRMYAKYDHVYRRSYLELKKKKNII